MQRTTVMLPSKLKVQARRQAKKRGVSLSELIRESLEAALGSVEASRRASDPLFTDEAVFVGDAPSDLSRNHDRYLYEEDPNIQ
jgi:Arc/MetJ-type ribon-helix-helix transcriptional regulator